jgi:hypothetical protein
MAAGDIYSEETKDFDLSPNNIGYGKVSGYLGYGSFSGADVKVVVHVPKSKYAQDTLKREINDLERDAQNESLIINDLEGAVNLPFNLNVGGENQVIESTPELLAFRVESYERLDVINRQLSNKQEELSSVLNAPTTITLGEISSLSWSIFREKSPVRPLGSVYPKSYTRGPRTIGGSMVFTVFNKHALHQLLDSNFKHYSTGTTDYEKQQYTATLIDQLPPLDISLAFVNEYGTVSHMGIYGVDFMQEGTTFSVEDIFSENVIQYTARDLDPMKAVQTAVRNKDGIENEWTKTATQLMAEEDDLYGHLKRRNPFI